MDDEDKVFNSKITRIHFLQESNLYDLLDIKPATPVHIKSSEDETCIFKARCDKYYVPKKRSRLKVRTVREIRNLFEQDNYSFILENIEKQQCSLLNKIRAGSATDDNTQSMAQKLLNADHPITRTAWQMLNNINPEKNVNPTQFVLWNGRRIRVVGSRGGKAKFICNHDLEKKNIDETKKTCVKDWNIKKKRGLLRNSLNIKFKPGPLRKKKKLDISHQKYQMGPIELVNLPKPALDIQPSYGTVVEPTISKLLNKLRPEDGFITEKWAELAVSVLGTYKNNNVVQLDKDNCVTFHLSYKCDQNRILMRRDISNMSTDCDNVTSPKYVLQNEFDNMLEIKTTMSKILDAVEISINQDSMYSSDIESNTTQEPSDGNNINNIKEKNKKKYAELDKLAVTVIQLPGTEKNNTQELCGKPYCNLGCICESVNCTYKFKQHCGYFECMFRCKCELLKNKDLETIENSCSELIPGLVNLDTKINANLSREEQKFHQTVVFSGEKSILIKTRKRNAKSAKLYAEFNNDMRLKDILEQKKILTIIDKKLKCSNIEPWCMVHNLYKCFCKGRFTETSAVNKSESIPIPNVIANLENLNPSEHDTFDRRVLRVRHSAEKPKSIRLVEFDDSRESCARTDVFIGRKHDDDYYKVTNNKIKEMEKNDTRLRKKIARMVKTTSLYKPPIVQLSNVIQRPESDNSEDLIIDHETQLVSHFNNKHQKNKLYTDKNDIDTSKNLVEETAEQSFKLINVTTLDSSDTFKDSSTGPNIPFEISGDIYKPIKGTRVSHEFLTPWIAKSYKNYKEQLNSGTPTLERPKRGTIILHLWEYLLSRYRNRRNLFLTTTKRPFRMYIATDPSKPFFKNCINIDTIRFAELHKYPCVVKKLLTNATNKDYFCILGGWDDCWEMIGSVKKHESENNDHLSNTESFCQDFHFEVDGNETVTSNYLQEVNNERSKWFLLKLENDFTEIYCHKKGFYVEREKILHAINLARLTHKTIVINKPTHTEIADIPFGIYALPVTSEYCALVGPYEIDESLGFEVVKARRNLIKQKSTTGFWITTNKVDNMKVLDDPMSFMPTNSEQKDESSLLTETAADYLDISIDVNSIDPSTSHEDSIQNKQNTDNINQISKMVKPIKIRRSNGFYHLTSKNRIVKQQLQKNTVTSTLLINEKNLRINSHKQILSSEKSNESQTEAKEKRSLGGSEDEKKNIDTKKTGMFILKPDEINKKIAICKVTEKHKDEIEMSLDIETFLNSPDARSAPENDVLLISDEDEDDTEKWEDVWIKCSNIKNLGWIGARRNKEKLMYINFPGFQSKNLYNETEAFDLINKVLSIRMKIPAHIKLQWKVFKSTQASKADVQLLKRLFLKPKLAGKFKFIEKNVLESTITRDKRYVNKVSSHSSSQQYEDHQNCSTNKTSGIIEGLEETSKLLEEESVLLLNESDKRQTEISQTLNVPEELKLKMSETLQGLLTMNEDVLDV